MIEENGFLRKNIPTFSVNLLINPHQLPMNRRHALRHIALISGGLALIPSCDFSSDDILAAYEKLKVTASQKELLGVVSNTIIPSGEIKGALDIAVPDFILVMVNDCYTEEAQGKFVNGLKAFPEFAGSGFAGLSVKEREAKIQEGLSLEGDDSEAGQKQKDIAFFLNNTKRLTIQGYMASEYIQTEVIPYSLIPGPYNGAVLISDIQKPRING
ncbi:gluconate 2-dehydrogenase subunit 3-like protein [Algoriphagus zhangzhouensis]|uniref:Gluconate 2-dehydrogenase subunit 3 n=2 Tax=Algoriphagus zhangzhouensis TaxID=1073327 RepID=A0A1M7ZAR2_9BACT|nr:gluconate 2-dehydrogenase subunit 3-like protein [Algoriphagus zhangzhouensis]SHO61993.1 Gluconate 2-dehydrogenase subunit 3 [Algoriphagus zhangzhouensis]